MSRNVVETRIALDQEIDFIARKAAAERGRSKRRQMAIVIRQWARKLDERRRLGGDQRPN